MSVSADALVRMLRGGEWSDGCASATGAAHAFGNDQLRDVQYQNDMCRTAGPLAKREASTYHHPPDGAASAVVPRGESETALLCGLLN
jgi:hypothetical protein